MSRESKNPVSGSPRPILVPCLIVLLIGMALSIMGLWSYYSVEKAGLLAAAQGQKGMMLFLWLGSMFQAPLTTPDRALLDFILSHWRLIALICGVSLFFFLVLAETGNYRGVEHGSGHWATKRERKPFRRSSEHDMPLAHQIYLSANSKPANNNVFVLAAPGGGKTFRVIIPGMEAISRPGKTQGSFVCTDTKGALYRDTAKMMRARGLPIYLLNVADPGYSNHYNPLENVHAERKATEIPTLVKLFVKNLRDEEASPGDAIWEESFEHLLNAVWQYQYDYPVNPATGQPETRAMWRTSELIRSIETGDDGRILPTCELASIIAAIRRIDPLSPIVSNYEYVIEKPAGETRSSVIFSSGKIQLFENEILAPMMHDNEIPIDKIVQCPSAVYLNYEIGSAFRPIAALFIEQIFMSAYYVAEKRYAGRLPINLKMFFDELPNICSIYSLPQRLSTSRSYGMDIVLSVQSMQQLKKMFDKAEQTLLNNCVTHVYLGTGEPDALKQISENLGKTTTSEISHSRSAGVSGGSGSNSDRVIGREIALPSEIYSMPDLYAIVKQQHHHPIFARKFKTEKQKWYKLLGGKGGPENNRSIEADYEDLAVLHRLRYARIYAERTKQKQEENEVSPI